MDESGAESTEKLHFFYDAQSRPAFEEYNDVKYRYVYNLQGDIVGIVDSAGNLVVEYKYDAWGKPISITGSLKNTLGEHNPFRYRGYVYEAETELYYLLNRYYAASQNRFIMADSTIATGKRGTIQNVYNYCRNNPVIYHDVCGNTEEIVDEIIDYVGCTEDDYNVLLIIYVPDVENREKLEIGHMEVALKYKDEWLVYSYGPESIDGLQLNSGSQDAVLKVRNNKWKTKYKCTSYGIATYRPSLVIHHAIRVIASDLGKENFTGVPKKGAYKFANKDYGTYSLLSELGHVCRDYCDRILLSMNIYILHEPNPDTYFPKGFYNDYLSRIK